MQPSFAITKRGDCLKRKKRQQSTLDHIAVKQVVTIQSYIFSKGTDIVPTKTLVKCTHLFFKPIY